MPTIATRASASARGYGFAGVKEGVVSETFTSSTTWTVPSNVTNLVAVIGKGQDGTGSYPAELQGPSGTASNSSSGSGPYSLPLLWSLIAAPASTAVSNFNQGGYQLNTDGRSFTFYPSNTYSWVTDPYTPAPPFPANPYFIAGTWYLDAYGTVPNPPSGSATYGVAYGGYRAIGQAYALGFNGANTTGFGYTFTGGGVSGSYPNEVGVAATPVSYTNIPVTPGSSFSLSIPAGGYITVQYIGAV